MKGLIFILFTILWLSACRERYNVPLLPKETGFLVVEGFINTNGQTKIHLSRTTLVEDNQILFEKSATVFIEDSDNNTFPLFEEDSGRYVSQALVLDNSKTYRLNITTASAKKYLSSFVKPIITPAIDSITWIRYNGGAEIYVNVKDPINSLGYYRWEYDETWEFQSQYKSNVKVNYDPSPLGPQNVKVVYRYPTFAHEDSFYTCWQRRSSSAIKVGSTEKLAQAQIFYPIIFYPRGSWELSRLYSVNIRQYGLSKEGYDFYSRMKKNTESLGSLFDAQPSEIRGNVVNVSDETEVVIGHVDASSVTERRTFIDNKDLVEWNYDSGCEDELFVENIPDSIIGKIINEKRIPTRVIEQGGSIIEIYAAQNFCVDCTLRGDNIKPSFWP